MIKPFLNGTDRWLTPPALIEALGPFDLDPCCEAVMPWRTANSMLDEAADGLKAEWAGRVWMNPPYSNVMPWVRRFADHGDGITLTAAKSTDARWGQLLLERCDAVMFLAGRIAFHYPDGTPSTGKWLPNALWAIGEQNVEALHRLPKVSEYRGVIMRRM